MKTSSKALRHRAAAWLAAALACAVIAEIRPSRFALLALVVFPMMRENQADPGLTGGRRRLLGPDESIPHGQGPCHSGRTRQKSPPTHAPIADSLPRHMPASF